MTCVRPSFIVLGLPGNALRVPDQEAQEILRSHTVFCGGRRQRELAAPWLPSAHRWLPFRGTQDLLRHAQELQEPIVMLASGDPLYHGIASSLLACQPTPRLKVVPWFTSLQLLCNRLLKPYAMLHTVSVHGRDWHELDRALLRGERLIGVLTDAVRGPAAISQRLLAYGYGHYSLHVGENLESPTESVSSLDLLNAAGRAFAEPNCVLLESESATGAGCGLDEARLSGLAQRPDMVTKMPIRLASLARLELAQRKCLWDVGFCTGSVAIEARRMNPDLRVVAFEKRPECEALIEHNARTHGTPGITVVMGDFLRQDLKSFPQPDAVFIGGHGGRLEEVFAAVDSVLLPGGRIVMNAVLSQSRTCFESCAFRLRYQQAPALRLQVDDHNPITVLTAQKPRTTSAPHHP